MVETCSCVTYYFYKTLFLTVVNLYVDFCVSFARTVGTNKAMEFSSNPL